MADILNQAKKRLIVALDVDTGAEALELVARTKDFAGGYKIGLQLFIREGPALVKKLVAGRNGVFLDLKLHDIPNTIEAASRAMAAMGVSMFTVHCLNGRQALTRCREGLLEFCAKEGLTEPMILAVTVLTSLTDAEIHGLGIPYNTSLAVEVLAGQAHAAGVRGFVASAREARQLKQLFPDIFLVTPGIRPGGAAADDQARTMTPAEAILAGADALVVGRPIVRSPDPAKAAKAILREIAENI